MTRAKAGRPPKHKPRVQKHEIVEAALELLDDEGVQGLTMRALGRRLKVNPMTLYHHIGGRADLLQSLSDHVYDRVTSKDSGTAREKIESLLTSYYRAVMKHPQLSLGIFSTPGSLSKEAVRITDELLTLLGEAKLPPARAKLWLSILIDFTHGSSLATAMSFASNGNESALKSQSRDYSRGLGELLDSLFRE